MYVCALLHIVLILYTFVKEAERIIYINSHDKHTHAY